RKEIQPVHVDAALDQWVRVQSALYAAIWRARTAGEQRILRALATEPQLMITSAHALARFRLGPKSSVHKSAVRLVGDEHLMTMPAGGYAFDDPFFKRWIEIEVLPGLGLSQE